MRGRRAGEGQFGDELFRRGQPPCLVYQIGQLVGVDSCQVDDPGTRQSRSRVLKQGECSVWVAGVVSVGGGDVVVAVQAEQADRQAA